MMKTALSFASAIGVMLCCLVLAVVIAVVIEAGVLYFFGYQMKSTEYMIGFLTATFFWPLEKRVKEAFAARATRP
jgi:hypothetical protein